MTERARATLAQVAARAAVPHKPLRDLAELPECVQLSFGAKSQGRPAQEHN